MNPKFSHIGSKLECQGCGSFAPLFVKSLMLRTGVLSMGDVILTVMLYLSRAEYMKKYKKNGKSFKHFFFLNRKPAVELEPPTPQPQKFHKNARNN